MEQAARNDPEIQFDAHGIDPIPDRSAASSPLATVLTGPNRATARRSASMPLRARKPGCAR